MTKEPWMEEARELLEDYANNVSYGGDPKRSSLTDEDKIISFISTQRKKAREEVIREIIETIKEYAEVRDMEVFPLIHRLSGLK